MPKEISSKNTLSATEKFENLLVQKKNGIDHELLAMGIEMAVYHIESGVRKFPDFVRVMVEDIGDSVRPYLKSFYNGARDMPGMEELRKEMTPYEKVYATDVFSICLNEVAEEDPGKSQVTPADLENLENDAEDSLLAEMKEEALYRMKNISLYDGVIESFEEDGVPQVYEPPYGASDWLEEDELERIKEVEKHEDILVWGVIRRFVTNIITGDDEAEDHLLYVSKSKEKWQDEREQLLNGNPHVYTLRLGRLDSKIVKIYMSPGSTPLIS